MKLLCVFLMVFFVGLASPVSASELNLEDIIPEQVKTDSAHTLRVNSHLPIVDWVDGIGAHYGVRLDSQGIIFLDELGAGYQVSLQRDAYHTRYASEGAAVVLNARIKAGYALYNKDDVLVGVLGTLGGDIFHQQGHLGIGGGVEAGAELMILSSIVNGRLVAIHLLPSQNALQIQSELVFSLQGKLQWIDEVQFVADFYYAFETAIQRFYMGVTGHKQLGDSPVSAFLGLGFHVSNAHHQGRVRPSIQLGVRISLGNNRKKDDDNKKDDPEDDDQNSEEDDDDDDWGDFDDDWFSGF